MQAHLMSLAALLGGWSLILAGIFAWLSRVANDRLLSHWRQQENSALERLKDQLSADRLLLETAIKGAQVGQDVNQQKRLAAIERLWAVTLELRSSFSSATFFFTILMPSEYDSALAGTNPFSAAIREINDDWITKRMEAPGKVESDRPYLGETLWLRFFAYRAFLGRLAVLISMGKEKGKIKDWKQDSGVKQLLGSVLAPQVVESILKEPLLNSATSALESQILEEMSRIVSGRRTAIESFEYAKDLQKSLSQYVAARSGSSLFTGQV